MLSTGLHFVKLSKSEKGFTSSRQLDLLFRLWVSYVLLSTVGGESVRLGGEARTRSVPDHSQKATGSLWPGLAKAPSRHAALAPGQDGSPCPGGNETKNGELCCCFILLAVVLKCEGFCWTAPVPGALYKSWNIAVLAVVFSAVVYRAAAAATAGLQHSAGSWGAIQILDHCCCGGARRGLPLRHQQHRKATVSLQRLAGLLRAIASLGGVSSLLVLGGLGADL